ncbi:hypothetical protein KAW65_09010 [candidate division WOR-3 bacterium]|nr:hypothetical protein [candidate division WOR-3 bacterium]
MEIVKSRITKKELIANIRYFKTMIKAVVDVKRRIIAVEDELHSDLEVYLLEDGSEQEDIWGINLYPYQNRDNFIEYTALVNIRPHQNNQSMEIEDFNLRKKIEDIVFELIDYES